MSKKALLKAYIIHTPIFLRGGWPPVDLRAVCLVLAIVHKIDNDAQEV